MSRSRRRAREPCRDNCEAGADRYARCAARARSARAGEHRTRDGRMLAAFGRIDVLVNNAGANLRKLAVDVTARGMERGDGGEPDRDVLYDAADRPSPDRARGRRSIISIASTHALVGAVERSTYGISKAALVQMTRMLAVEWAGHGVRVNAVASGRLATASPSRAEKGADQGYMEAMLKRIPLHRLATVEEVAGAVVYLASPAGGIDHRSDAGARWRFDSGMKLDFSPSARLIPQCGRWPQAARRGGCRPSAPSGRLGGRGAPQSRPIARIAALSAATPPGLSA